MFKYISARYLEGVSVYICFYGPLFVVLSQGDVTFSAAIILCAVMFISGIV